MKKLALLLTFVLMLSLFAVPVSAEETLTDLTKVYNNLSSYLYTPYVEQSKYYEPYSKKMEEIKELLKSDSITQEEISKYYNELREAYSAMMRDVYDYSAFDELIEDFQTLNSAPFTEETWKKLVSVYDSIQRELSSPSLFARKKTTTEKEYYDHMKKHIASFSSSFSSAFSALELIEKPQNIGKDYFSGYTAYIRISSDNILFQQSELWAEHLKVLEKAEALCEQANPRAARMNQEYTNLSESYAKISKEVYKSNLASDALLKYDDLLKTDYSSASWERYEMQITALREAYAKIHTVFIPTKSNESRAQEFVDAYFKKLAASSDTAYQNLISTELFHALKNLCSNAKAVEISDGLEIKYNLLQDAVKNGQDVLNNKDALVAEFEEAIEDVQNALENFSLAEDHLEKEQAKVVKQDKAASRWIVIFSVFSFFASVLCAGFLSRRQFGRIDWTK